MSRVQEAIALMRSENVTANKAAEQIGVRVSAVYAAIKREQKKAGMIPCPCCGTMVDPDRVRR